MVATHLKCTRGPIENRSRDACCCYQNIASPLMVLITTHVHCWHAALLPHFLLIPALCSQIMALPGSWYQAFLEAAPSAGQQSTQRQRAQAPVLFVHMPRDEHTAARVKESLELRHNKVSPMVVGENGGTARPVSSPQMPLLNGSCSRTTDS